MALPRDRFRGLATVGLAIGLIVAACGSSAPVQNQPTGGASGAGSSVSSSLASGLSSNLDSLASYQFTESLAGSSGGSSPTPDATPGTAAGPSAGAGAFRIAGTVINGPTRSIWISAPGGVQYVVVGGQAWSTNDGITWMGFDATDAGLTDLLPGSQYGTWFDTYSADFKVVGDESKNGVQCVHYKGDASLASRYAATAGTSAGLQADLWIARDGNYPVSGVYGFAGSFGFSFDITNVNDAANSVTPPTNVVAIPT